MTFTLKELFCKAKTEILFTALMSKQSLTCYVMIPWNLPARHKFLNANRYLNNLCKYSWTTHMEINLSSLEIFLKKTYVLTRGFRNLRFNLRFNRTYVLTYVLKRGFRKRHKQFKFSTLKEFELFAAFHKNLSCWRSNLQYLIFL